MTVPTKAAMNPIAIPATPPGPPFSELKSGCPFPAIESQISAYSSIPAVREVLRVTGMDAVFEIREFPSVPMPIAKSSDAPALACCGD